MIFYVVINPLFNMKSSVGVILKLDPFTVKDYQFHFKTVSLKKGFTCLLTPTPFSAIFLTKSNSKYHLVG